MSTSSGSGNDPSVQPTPPASANPPPPWPLSKVIAATVLVDALTLLATYVLGGFEGLSTGGVWALIFGVTFSYAVGVGLMAAIFYSSRSYDDQAYNAARDQFKDRAGDRGPE